MVIKNFSYCFYVILLLSAYNVFACAKTEAENRAAMTACAAAAAYHATSSPAGTPPSANHSRTAPSVSSPPTSPSTKPITLDILQAMRRNGHTPAGQSAWLTDQFLKGSPTHELNHREFYLGDPTEADFKASQDDGWDS